MASGATGAVELVWRMVEGERGIVGEFFLDAREVLAKSKFLPSPFFGFVLSQLSFLLVRVLPGFFHSLSPPKAA